MNALLKVLATLSIKFYCTFKIAFWRQNRIETATEWNRSSAAIYFPFSAIPRENQTATFIKKISQIFKLDSLQNVPTNFAWRYFVTTKFISSSHIALEMR